MVKSIILLIAAILYGFKLPAQTILISYGATWAYSDQGKAPDANWQTAAYQHAAWKTGPALFGYGIKAPATAVSFGPDPQNKYITTYFRKTFTLANPAQFGAYQASIKRDDGVVVYLNGTEVFRNNLPDRPITYNTKASSAADNGLEALHFPVPAAGFIQGENVIAVEVHQTNPLSYDMAFDLELTGSPNGQQSNQGPPQVLRIRRHLPAEKSSTATALTFRITFSEKVTGVDAADFSVVAEDGAVSGFVAANAVSPADSSAYDVTVTGISGAGELRLDLHAIDTGITDKDGNMVAGYTGGQSYTIAPPRNDTLIPFQALWQYLDNGSDQDTAWQEPSFADISWHTGPALFGYGIKAPATVVGFGPDPQNKYITTYFRKTFALADPAQYLLYRAKVRRDDGIVVYVNGTEVYRNNLPAGPISYLRRATSAADEGKDVREFAIPVTEFVQGENVIAVEVHQTNPLSYDMTFDLELTASTAVQPADKTPPFVAAIKRHQPEEKATNAPALTFRVTFSEKVIGLDAADFNVVNEAGAVSGVVAANAVTWLDSTSYEVTVGGVSGEGELRLDLKATDTGIADLAGNSLSASYSAGQSYTVTTNPPVSPALTRGPYLQMGSQTALTLRWRTKKAEDSRVAVGTSFGSYPLEFTDARATTEHEVRVSGLTPGTRYYYHFGSSSRKLQSGADNYFATAPPAGNTEKVGIAVFGDCGKKESVLQSNTLQAYRRHVGANPAALLLLLGDNAYPDGTDGDYQLGFFNAYDSTILKNHVMFPAPGNHDYHTTSAAARTAPYYNIFTMPTKGESGGIASKTEAYYSFDWGNIHFISLDSHGTEMPDNLRLSDTLGAQANWVKKDLEANTRPWVIVYWHHPPYSMGSHNSDKEDELAFIRENFLRILDRYGVDLVLTGHSHNYERSYLLDSYYGLEAHFDPAQHARSTSSGKYDGSADSCPYVKEPGIPHQGAVYVVAGSAAQVGKAQPSWPHAALPFSDNKGGMLYLEVADNRLDAKYLRSDGKIGDQFTMLKSVNKTRAIAANGSTPTRLTASWIGDYKWSTGETSRSITVNPGGATTYEVTDSQGCLRDAFRINVTAGIHLQAQPATPPYAKALAAGPQIFPTLVSRGTRIMVQTPAWGQMQARVVDINGRFISQAAFHNSTYIETAALPAGMYLLLLQGDNYMKTQKFMVTD